MYMEPYGYLDLNNLTVYIRSQQDCEKIARIIKVCLTSIDEFISGVTVNTTVNNELIVAAQEKFNIPNTVQAKMVCTKYVNTGDTGRGVEDNKIMASLINQHSPKTYKTSEGIDLTNFQTKFVDFIDRSLNGVSHGNKRGLEVYLETIDNAVMQGTKRPYLLGRFISRIQEYKSIKPILDIVNSGSVAELMSTLKQINDFEDAHISNSKSSDQDLVESLLNTTEELADYRAKDIPTNYIVEKYLEVQVDKLDYNHINKECGTDLSEIEVYNEILGLEEKGLCGYSLPTSTLLDNIKASGVYYDRGDNKIDGLENNDNIKFILGPLRKMILDELAYRNI